MNKYAFDKAVIMQGAKDLGLPEEFIRQISAYADFLQSNHHEEFFAAVLEDFFTGGKWVNAEEMPEFLQKFPVKNCFFWNWLWLPYRWQRSIFKRTICLWKFSLRG